MTSSPPDPRRAVLLFSRTPGREAAVKGLAGDGGARRLLGAWRTLFAAGLAADLPLVTLIVVGDGPAPEGALQLSQRGTDFGARLAHAFADVRAAGFDQVVAIPGDVPALSSVEVAAAFAAIDQGGVGLGPCPDGGVYLIGVAGDPGPLLDSVAWGSARVLADLGANARRLGRGVALLAPRRDLDRRHDLVALFGEPLVATLGRVLRRAVSGSGPMSTRVAWLLAGGAVVAPFAPRPPPLTRPAAA